MQQSNSSGSHSQDQPSLLYFPHVFCFFSEIVITLIGIKSQCTPAFTYCYYRNNFRGAYRVFKVNEISDNLKCVGITRNESSLRCWPWRWATVFPCCGFLLLWWHLSLAHWESAQLTAMALFVTQATAVRCLQVSQGSPTLTPTRGMQLEYSTEDRQNFYVGVLWLARSSKANLFCL